MNLFLIVFLVSYLVFYNLFKLLILLNQYRCERSFFSKLENEMVLCCAEGMPELCFGKLWSDL